MIENDKKNFANVCLISLAVYTIVDLFPLMKILLDI